MQPNSGVFRADRKKYLLPQHLGSYVCNLQWQAITIPTNLDDFEKELDR